MANAGDLYEDTDGDGVGDGTRLTVDLSSFTFLIPGSGSSLDISIALTSTDSFEPLAIDDVRIADQIPEPASALIVALASTALLSIRRKTA